MKVTQDSID
jgi:hypothetical protein